MNSAKPNDQQVFEVLEDLRKITSEDNKVEYLRDNFNGHRPLHYILKMNYCSNIASMLPDGTPPYTKNETDGPTSASLWQYLNVFPVFVRSAQSSKMKMLQIENTFIEMLEAVEPEEAEVVCLAKDRKLEQKYDISLSLIDKAFPGLITHAAEMPEIKPVTPEERANSLLETAKDLRAKARELQTEAREMEKEAKELLEDSDDTVEATAAD